MEYTITWHDTQWSLIRNLSEKARYPWTLTNGAVREPIGPVSLLDAQRMAEFALLRYPRHRHERTGE